MCQAEQTRSHGTRARDMRIGGYRCEPARTARVPRVDATPWGAEKPEPAAASRAAMSDVTHFFSATAATPHPPSEMQATGANTHSDTL